MAKPDVRKLKVDLEDFVEGSGLPTQHTATERRQGQPKAAETSDEQPKKAARPRKVAKKEVRLKHTFLIRPSLRKALRRMALEEDTTMQVLLMRGLQAIGLPIIDDDLKDARSE